MIIALDNRLVRYDIRASIAHAEMLGEQKLLSAPDLRRHSRGPDGHRRGARARRCGAFPSSKRIARPPSRICSPRASAQPAAVCMPAARATIRCSRRCGCTCAMPRRQLRRGAIGGRRCARCLGRAACAIRSFPATPTCSRPCRAASRSGRRDLPRKSATMPRASSSRSGASARTPWDPRPASAPRISTSAAKRRAGASDFAVTQEPVTAVQLSRGKAEAQLLFEITLLTQDLGRLAADLLLFYTQEFGYRELCRRPSPPAPPSCRKSAIPMSSS